MNKKKKYFDINKCHERKFTWLQSLIKLNNVDFVLKLIYLMVPMW